MSTAPEPPLTGGSVASTPASTASRAAGRERVRLDLAYDGTDFHGFAENVGVETVAGRLRAALERVLGEPLALTCAGRTDAGVHARHQVVTFDVSAGRLDAARLRDSLNSMLAPAIAVRSVAVVDEDFDARFSARWRSYRYSVLNAEVPAPHLARTSWWVPTPLDVSAMRDAATVLRGEHDFGSFCRVPKGVPGASLVRRVLHTGWVDEAEPGLLRFEIAATAFCHQMVRSIVGTLVDLGRGAARVQDLGAVLAAQDRAAAGNLAPPHGLCLWQVGYGDDPPPA